MDFKRGDNIVAQFKISGSLMIPSRPFFIIGEIVSGEIKIGNYVDLKTIGINKKVKIQAIEFLLKRINNTSQEDIALGVIEINERDIKRMRGITDSDSPLDITTN